MRIYVLEEYNQTNKLTRYWLFGELEKLLSFDSFCKEQPKAKEGFTYQINISELQDRSNMRAGSLVRFRHPDHKTKVGLITSIGSPTPIAQMLWSNGEKGAIHTKWLEVICK